VRTDPPPERPAQKDVLHPRAHGGTREPVPPRPDAGPRIRAGPRGTSARRPPPPRSPRAARRCAPASSCPAGRRTRTRAPASCPRPEGLARRQRAHPRSRGSRRPRTLPSRRAPATITSPSATICDRGRNQEVRSPAGARGRRAQPRRARPPRASGRAREARSPRCSCRRARSAAGRRSGRSPCTATAPDASRPAKIRSIQPLRFTTPRAATTGQKFRIASLTPATPARARAACRPAAAARTGAATRAGAGRRGAPPTRARARGSRDWGASPKYTAPPIIAAIMARFQKTGATYETKKRLWLFRTPSAHAEMTSTPVIGKRMRTSRMVTSCFAPSHSGKKAATSNGASAQPTMARPPATAVRMPSDALLRSGAHLRHDAGLEQLGVNGDERGRQGALPRRFCSTFGMRRAARQASAKSLEPK
jgi:hypothetical protein